MQNLGKLLEKLELMRLKTKVVGLFGLVVIGLTTLAFDRVHEYYVSVTRVEYIKEEQSLQIISQVFIDDFEKLIHERYDENIVMAIPNESEMIDRYVERYLRSKLVFTINGQLSEYKFIGKKYEDDIVYCYLEIEGIEAIESLTITNEILYDLYDEQENIVRTKVNSKNKSFVLNSSNTEAVLNFN